MGKKGTKRKTRWRVLPIGGEDGCNGVCSNNEDEVDGDRDSVSPLNSSTAGTSYARASGQQRILRTKSTSSSRSGNYNYRHRSYYQQPQDTNQPLVTTEKKTFNEEEYTKITTPRQDVLFKKGYLGRKRLTAVPTAETTANVKHINSNPDSTAADVANGIDQNGEMTENDQTSSEVLSPEEEQPQYLFAMNGYVDQTGGPPPGLYFVNGSGYELYDPYSGNVTVVVGPAPHYGGPPVLAGVPCQPLPLQPLEWFNPAFVPYVTAPCHNGLASARDRRKRYSTDSQNCSPQSSESTEPPGSPQECELEASQPGDPSGPLMYSQPPAYVYPGYMFGPPIYNVNGITLQGAPTQPPSCDLTGSNKRRKKKRRKRRRRGGAEDGCSEESSSDEKELEEPVSFTSQESSSQEIESDSKQSTNRKTLNNDSSISSPLSSCQTLTPTDHTNSPTWLKSTGEQSAAFDSQTPLPIHLQKENDSTPSAENDICSEKITCNNSEASVDEIQESAQHYSEEAVQLSEYNNSDLNSVHLSEEPKGTEEVIPHSDPCIAESNSLEQQETLVLQQTANIKNPSCITSNHCCAIDNEINVTQEINSTVNEKQFAENIPTSKVEDIETVPQCNGGLSSSTSNEDSTKTGDSTKVNKQKKSGKQLNSKNKKNSKGKEGKQKKSTGLSATVATSDSVQKKGNKKKDDKIVTDNTVQLPINSIPSEITIQEQDKIDKVECYNILNNFDEKQIPNSKTQDILRSEMDGNESKTPPTSPSSASPEAKIQDIESDTSCQNDNGAAQKSTIEEPPTRPARKEKLKSLASSKLPDQSQIQKSAIKSLELSSISLRPDVPKSETKILHEPSSSQQFKDTANILDSITEALIREPTMQSTVSKDTSNTLTGSKSEILKTEDSPKYVPVEERIPELQKEDCRFEPQSASSQENNEMSVVPVPPARSKKSNVPSNQKSPDVIPLWNTEDADIKEESSGDSTTSSTTHESEESVIELLSSTNTSPDDKQKQELSSDEEEGIIFREKQYVNSEIMDIKSIPPDKSDICTPSISGPSLKDSSQFSEQNKPLNPQSLQDEFPHSTVCMQHLQEYADELSRNVILEAVHEAPKRKFTRPITEAVTRWLRSQSPEVLSLSPPEDGTESEASSEEQEQEQNEKSIETDGNKEQMTGQKNVFCNPLPVPSLESCNCVLDCDCVDHSSCSDGIGRRVALNKNESKFENDNNELSVSRNEILISGDENKNCLSCESKCNTPNVNSRGEGAYLPPCSENISTLNRSVCNYNKKEKTQFDSNNVQIMTKEDHGLEFERNLMNKSQIHSACKMKQASAASYKTELVKEGEICKVDETNLTEDDEFSFASDETLECEWDSWDCSPAKPVPVKSINKTSTPTDDLLTRTPDYCSQICDPTVSVAKYYSLGALQPDKNMMKLDKDEVDSNSTNSSDEEVDALKHFQHEFGADDGLQTEKNVQDIQTKEEAGGDVYKSCYGESGPRTRFTNDDDKNAYYSCVSQRAQAAHIFNRKSSLLVSRLKGDGPFPCGGICCILQ